jgi:hypothetical protein
LKYDSKIKIFNQNNTDKTRQNPAVRALRDFHLIRQYQIIDIKLEFVKSSVFKQIYEKIITFKLDLYMEGRSARSTQRHKYRVLEEESQLVGRIIELACEYGRYGYRRITALLRQEGFHVNHKRVERIWYRKGLKVPKKQPKRGRLWSSCVRKRAEYPNHL